MRNNLGNTIPRNWLVAEYLLDWNANASVGTNGTATNVTWVKTNKWYQNQAWSFSWSNSNILVNSNMWFTIYSYIDINWWFAINSWQSNKYIMSLWGNTGWALFIAISLTYDWYIRFDFWNYYISTLTWNGLFYFFRIVKQWSLVYIYINNILVHSWVFIAWSDIWNWFWIFCPIWAQSAANGSWLAQTIRFYNRILSDNEAQILYYEWLRKLWPTDVSSYPWLLNWLVWYFDFKSSIHNLVSWLLPSWTWTLTTDRFWNNDSAYNFNWTSNWLDTILSIWSWNKTVVINFKSPVVANTWSVSTIFKLDTWTDGYDSLAFSYNHNNSTFKTAFNVATTSLTYYAAKINTVLEANTYYQITWIYDWTTLKAFLNWLLETSTAVSWTMNNAYRLLIAKWAISSWYFNWTIDSIMIFNRALSSDEVNTIYKLTSQDYIYPAPSYGLLSLREWLVLDLDWNWNDKSWNWNNGTLINSPTKIRQGKAKWLSYNWSNQRVDIPHNALFNFTNAFTISFDIKKNIIVTWKWILWKWGYQPNSWATNQFLFETDSSWRIMFYVNTWSNSVLATNKTLVIDKIYRVTAKYDWSNMKIFINWVLDNALAKTWNMVVTWTLQRIEIWSYASLLWDWYFNWTILNPKIRNRALSDKEIEADYYGSKWNFIY